MISINFLNQIFENNFKEFGFSKNAPKNLKGIPEIFEEEISVIFEFN